MISSYLVGFTIDYDPNILFLILCYIRSMRCISSASYNNSLQVNEHRLQRYYFASVWSRLHMRSIQFYFVYSFCVHWCIIVMVAGVASWALIYWVFIWFGAQSIYCTATARHTHTYTPNACTHMCIWSLNVAYEVRRYGIYFVLRIYPITSKQYALHKNLEANAKKL